MLWEYCIDTLPAGGIFVTGDVDKRAVYDHLNNFGAQGWELVSSYATTHANGGSHLLVFVYKRPRGEVVVPPLPAGR